MHPSRRRRCVLRSSRVESIEPRLLFSAHPAGDFTLDDMVETRSSPAPLVPLADINDLTGLTAARDLYGFDGSGQTVVIIDSGIAYRHGALGGGFGTGYRVVGGYDFAERDADPYDDGPVGSHGTHVAGIIASSDSTRPGVAPGVDLVALRVFDDSGAGRFEWVEEALRWVHANRHAFAHPITTVNLSIGSVWNSDTVPAWSTIEDELAMLESDGIFVAVAAGNSFASYLAPGLSYPAASPHVVPVSSIDNDGSLSYFSQRHARAIAAPGRSVLSTVPDYLGDRNGLDDDFARFSGTSMAAPYVAAASVLLREAYQFVGVTEVTPGTLSNLMRSTADVIYDAATNQQYCRLNLQRALEAIMPADDYGSSAEAAHRLGTLVDTLSVSGTVAQRGDHDFFCFTAGQSGRVHLTLNVSGALESHWELVGAVASEQTARAVSFDVVAGQTYTIGLGTSGGLGHYTLDARLTAGAGAPDTTPGRQDIRLDQRISSDGLWVSFTVARTGIVTFEALFAHARGDVDLELFDAQQRYVAGNYSSANGERIDVVARAGQTFYLHAYANGTANDDVDLRITNLVSQIGDRVSVVGTPGEDQFTFAPGATHVLTVNGVVYRFNPAAASRFSFDGLAGSDTATLNGTVGDDTAVLRVGSAEMAGLGYRVVVANVERVSALANGGGGDTVSLFDSPGDDVLRGSPRGVRLSGNGFVLEARGFGAVTVWATAGGRDVAGLNDSAGDDTFLASPGAASLSGRRFQIDVRGFDVVHAVASAGGFDQALLYDSAGNDVFVRSADRGQLYGPGFCNRAVGFEEIRAICNAGGHDVARLLDSALDDHLSGSGTSAQVANAAAAVWTYGFDVLWAHGGSGRDTADVAAVDYLLRLNGAWERRPG